MLHTNPKMINWVIVCINEFARRRSISPKAAFQYLYTFGGIAFMKEHYEAEHCLSIDDAVEDLSIICMNNGGSH